MVIVIQNYINPGPTLNATFFHQEVISRSANRPLKRESVHAAQFDAAVQQCQTKGPLPLGANVQRDT